MIAAPGASRLRFVVYTLFLCACQAPSCVSVNKGGREQPQCPLTGLPPARQFKAISWRAWRSHSVHLAGGHVAALVVRQFSPAKQEQQERWISSQPDQRGVPFRSSERACARPGAVPLRAGLVPEGGSPSPRPGHSHPSTPGSPPNQGDLADTQDPSFARVPGVTQLLEVKPKSEARSAQPQGQCQTSVPPGGHQEEAAQVEGSEQRHWAVTSEWGDSHSPPKTRGTHEWWREGGAWRTPARAFHPTLSPQVQPLPRSIWPRSLSGTRLPRGCA